MITVQMGEAAEIILASAVMMICRSDVVEDSWEGSMKTEANDDDFGGSYGDYEDSTYGHVFDPIEVNTEV